MPRFSSGRIAAGATASMPASSSALDAGKASLRLGRTDLPGWRLILPADAEAAARRVAWQARALRPLDRPHRPHSRAGRGGRHHRRRRCVGYIAPALDRAARADELGAQRRQRHRRRFRKHALPRLPKGSARSKRWSSAWRLARPHGPNGIKIAALDVPVFNAAALPGGYIVVFKPAITETDPRRARRRASRTRSRMSAAVM